MTALELWRLLSDSDPDSVAYVKRRGLEIAVRDKLLRLNYGRSGDAWLDAKALQAYRIAAPLRTPDGTVATLRLGAVTASADPAELTYPGIAPDGAILTMGHPEAAPAARTVYLTQGIADTVTLQLAGVVTVGALAERDPQELLGVLGNLSGREVVLCPSTDLVAGEKRPARGIAALAPLLVKQGASVRTVIPPSPYVSFADWRKYLGPDRFREAIGDTTQKPKEKPSTSRPTPVPTGSAAAPMPAPAPQAEPDEEEVPLPTVTPIKQRPITKSFASLCQILRTPALRQAVLGEGKLEYNEQALVPTIGRKPIDSYLVSRVRENCETRLTAGKKQTGPQFSSTDIEQACVYVGKERPYHPVVEYLESLRWDGQLRIAHIAEDVLQVPAPFQDALTSKILRCFMISAVARALKPGCKVDDMLVLQGPQGAMKGTFFRILAGDDWFSDSPVDLRNKDSYLMLRRVWILEWGELEALNRAGNDAAKGFLSSKSDLFRPPYGRDVEQFPRCSIIVGSTDKKQFLTDEAGNRRYWTVPVNDQIRVDLLQSWRDQLWAEAVVAYRKGEPWWLTPVENAKLRDRQRGYEIHDAWEDIVVPWMEEQMRQFVADEDKAPSLAMIFEDALKKPSGQWTDNDSKRLSRLLRRNGYESRPVTKGKNRGRRWFRVATDDTEPLF